jgi:hypothetical protein
VVGVQDPARAASAREALPGNTEGAGSRAGALTGGRHETPDALERQGYVSRSHDTGDRRLVHVTLTRQGHQAWRRATSSESEIEKKLISQLTVSEQDELARLLRRLLIASEAL